MCSLDGLTILLTGGAGYIGSHTCVELLASGCKVVVVDNLVNSSLIALKRVATIAGKTLSTDPEVPADITFYEVDVCDENSLKIVFGRHNIDAVIHFAGLKAVGESVKAPLGYYRNNVMGSIALLQQMAESNVKTLVFSSSATVYGATSAMPITESFNTGNTTSPYGQSKFVVEQILKDLSKDNSGWSTCALRYFNPVAAHPSGLIGEDPAGIPNNLFPYISQVASGKLEKLKIFGDTYHTPDGSGIRDYIHVVDLAKGHIYALSHLLSSSASGFSAFNLGTGVGRSVFEMMRAFERVSGKSIPYEVVERRSGDVAECWASTQSAESILGWKAQYDVDKMCQDAWNWQSKNPHGFAI